MKDFRDHLLGDLTRKERDKKGQIEALTNLVLRLDSAPTPSLHAHILDKVDLVFGASLKAPIAPWPAIVNHDDIDFSFLDCRGLVPNEVAGTVRSLNGPCIKVLSEFSECSVLEARLQGFTGYCFPLVEDDLVLTQFGLEYGLDFGMEPVLWVEDRAALAKVQHLDCPVLKVPPPDSEFGFDAIPTTRTLIVDLKSPDQVENFKGASHKMAMLLPQNILDTITSNHISSGDLHDSKEGPL